MYVYTYASLCVEKEREITLSISATSIQDCRRLLCVLASDEAAERGWVYFTEVPGIPSTDFDTLDNLWFHYSGGKFGFRVQKKIWIGCQRRWSPFFERIDWTTGENKAYRKWPEQFIWSADAPRGHLPLTNALRGTQLLQVLPRRKRNKHKEMTLIMT